MRKATLGFCLLVCILNGASAWAQTPSPTTPEEIQKMLDAKAWVPALRAIGPLLSPSNKAATNATKYSLLMMRGECLVQLKDAQTALIAYNQAATVADSLPENEAARAMAMLLHKCRVGVSFTAQTGDKTPLDLTDADARKRAMAALFADELPAFSTQADQAVKARSLPPILKLLPTLRDLHALEQVGTGDDKQTAALVQPLTDRINDLIDAELTRVSAQIQAIQQAASRTVTYGGGTFVQVNGTMQFSPADGQSGLTGENRQVLRDGITYLGDIKKTCDDLMAIARRYDRDGKRWQTLAKRTQGILDTATAVYDHE